MTEDRPAEKKADEVLSFEALIAEQGDITIPTREDVKADADEALPAVFFPDMGGTSIGGDVAPPRTLEDDLKDRINKRVLGGSAPKVRHMYVEGIVCGVLAAVIMAPIVLRMGLTQFQPWFSYMSMFIAGGAALWSLFGLQVETTSEGRRLSIGSAVFCAAVVVIAFWFRNVG